MKLFTATFLTESSDLTPIPTTENNWEISKYNKEAEAITFHGKILETWRSMAEGKGWEVAESICAVGTTGGRTVTAVYENIRNMIVSDLKMAMPVNAILLNMHGATMAHGYDDCEGDLLAHIREVVGPEVPIGVELDPHCHISKAMMEHATLIVLYKTVMHTDIKERAIELFKYLSDTLEGRIKPVMAVFDCRMMNNTGFDETVEPMKSFFEKVCTKEKEEGIISISPVHCFPLADIPDMGSKMLVITDGDQVLADKTAADLGMEFFEVGKQLKIGGVESALDQAELMVQKGEAPQCLCEVSDLIGCGFPTDGTEFLHAMLSRGMTNLAAGFICDPMVVATCIDIGVGVELMMRIGGKASPLSGPPLDLKVRIERVYKQLEITNYFGDKASCGDAVVLSAGDTELLVTSKRVCGADESTFKELGVEPANKDYLLFKYIGSLSNFTCVYGSNYSHINWPFTRISRPKWPWDEAPFAIEQAKELV